MGVVVQQHWEGHRFTPGSQICMSASEWWRLGKPLFIFAVVGQSMKNPSKGTLWARMKERVSNVCFCFENPESDLGSNEPRLSAPLWWCSTTEQWDYCFAVSFDSIFRWRLLPKISQPQHKSMKNKTTKDCSMHFNNLLKKTSYGKDDKNKLYNGHIVFAPFLNNPVVWAARYRICKPSHICIQQGAYFSFCVLKSC